MPNPKTPQQIRAIFGLAKRQGIEMDADTKAGLAATCSLGRTDHISELTFDEANVLIKNLGGETFTAQRRPRRTENFHRKQAGVTQIAQARHLKLMYDLAAGREISEAGLAKMGQRMIKHWPPRTTAETNKIVEALKAMNARTAAAGILPANSKKEAA